MSRIITPVQLTIDGHLFEGFYAVQADMVTVWKPGLGSRTIQFRRGQMKRKIQQLARELLAENTRLVEPPDYDPSPPRGATWMDVGLRKAA